MKQTIFETKQRAEELIHEAVDIWRKSDHSDFMEGVEQDPVFSLLMTALAYQTNETESELENMKADVVEEFTRMLTPYEVGHAIPATAVVETALQKGVPELELSETSLFLLADSGIKFMPLLNTRVLNANVRSIVRIDGRRWKVSLNFESPVKDLSRFTFVIKNQNFRDVKVTIKGQPLPLVKPWDYSELPLSPCFSIDTVLYNRTQTYAASATCLDLFARQNVRMYCVREHHSNRLIPTETESLDLIFEFSGIKDDFVFSKDSLSLNGVVLVNAQSGVVNLSSTSPIVRVTGYKGSSSEGDDYSQQFLHMLRPSADQIFGQTPIEVRRVAADRFNQGSLVRLLNNLISKYYSDFYAFQNLRDGANERVMQNLIEILGRMRDASNEDLELRVPGVYFLLRPQSESVRQQLGLSVTYMTTLGAAVNSLLDANSVFTAPSGFDSSLTRQIANPVPGSDEIRDDKEMASLSRYYMMTNDRLVTPADIKIFCYSELLTRYGIVRNMIKSIRVSHRHELEKRRSGYEILVEIMLADNSFIKRSFAQRISQVEILMQKMIEVRSTNIYPVSVVIQIESK